MTATIGRQIELTDCQPLLHPGRRMSNHSKLSQFLNGCLPLIEAEIRRFLPFGEPEAFLRAPARDYIERGGKRIRPAMVLLSCEALGGDRLKALTTAAAYEILQSFLLVHDDIEDDSELRRARPCLHRTCGVPLAINVGDYLHAKVYETVLAGRDLLGPDVTLRLMGEMVEVCEMTCEGQSYDIGWTARREIPTVAEFLGMLALKTGWYSGRGPCRAGAIIAGAAEESIDAIGKFGEAIAVAFQIRDDLLNLTISPEEAKQAPSGTTGWYGKERGGDVAEGKRTLMIIHLLEMCGEAERKDVLRILDKPRNQTTVDEVEKTIGLMQDYGSIAYAQELCEEKSRKGMDYLGMLPESDALTVLREMGEFLIRRNS